MQAEEVYGLIKGQVNQLNNNLPNLVATEVQEYLVENPPTGSGDMLASTYDPTNKEQDIYEYADTKLAKANIANNNTVATEGFALDARQANPSVPGSLGAQVATLNNKLTGLVKSATFSGTTDNTGNVAVSNDLTIYILSVKLNQDYLPIIFRSPVSHLQFINVKTFGGATLTSGATITGTYYYI